MITSIYLGSTRLDSSNVYLQGIANLAMANLDISASNKASFAGVKLSVSKVRGFTLALDWLILGNSVNDLATQRENFVGILGAILSSGGQVLKINKDNGVSIQIDVKSVKITGDLTTDNIMACPIRTEFATEYPVLQNQNLTSSDVYIINGGGMGIPMGIPLNMGVGGQNEAILNNNGNFDAYSVFIFYGPLTNPTLTNITTGKQLSINYSLTDPTQYIVIDTYNRTALLYTSGPSNGVNIRQYISGDFWVLAKGANTIHLGNSSFNSSGKCNVSYRDSYLGV